MNISYIIQIIQPPEPIHCIMGIDVDKLCPYYQHALLCLTELLNLYIPMIFPGRTYADIQGNYVWLIEVCTELFNDMTYNERKVINNRVNSQLDSKTKYSISILAFHFTKKLHGNEEKFMDIPYPEAEQRLCGMPLYETCYEDTLKMLVADLESNCMWQITSFFTNKVGSDRSIHKPTIIVKPYFGYILTGLKPVIFLLNFILYNLLWMFLSREHHCF